VQIERDSPDDMSNRLILLDCSATALITTLNPHWTWSSSVAANSSSGFLQIKFVSTSSFYKNNNSFGRSRQKWRKQEKNSQANLKELIIGMQTFSCLKAGYIYGVRVYVCTFHFCKILLLHEV